MNLYRKSLYMGKKNICICLICLMTLFYFLLGGIYLDEIATQNSQFQSHSISSTLLVESHNNSLVEDGNNVMEYCERHTSVFLSDTHDRRMNNRTAIYRLFIMLFILVCSLSTFYIAFRENVHYIFYQIMRFLHQSDGKKRISY